jgi:hypothetical protein
MNYIAIKNDSFVLIDSEDDEAKLIEDGFSIFSVEQYNEYISLHNEMSLAETMSLLESKADEYILFGEKLWNVIKKKVFAINTYNKSQGNDLTIDQMKALLATSDMLEKSLKSGSLNTAKDVAVYFKTVMPQYGSVCDFILSEVNTFMMP